jgi:hypothetical protein
VLGGIQKFRDYPSGLSVIHCNFLLAFLLPLYSEDRIVAQSGWRDDIPSGADETDSRTVEINGFAGGKYRKTRVIDVSKMRIGVLEMIESCAGNVVCLRFVCTACCCVLAD